MSTHRQRRKERRSTSEEHPPGRYVAWALLAIVVLSLAGAGASFALLPVQSAALVTASTIVSATLLMGMWAILENLREINDALTDTE
jgi:protein-S-isoprenylcysteine O-methyltransferase Ste14